MSKKWFISLGRGVTINKTLISEVFQSNGKYLIKGVYGETYVVSKKNFEEAKKVID